MSNASGFRVDTIGYVILYVKDVEKAAAFYRDALGIPWGAMSPGWGEGNATHFPGLCRPVRC